MATKLEEGGGDPDLDASLIAHKNDRGIDLCFLNQNSQKHSGALTECIAYFMVTLLDGFSIQSLFLYHIGYRTS